MAEEAKQQPQRTEPARTITESGAETASNLQSTPSEVETQTSASPTVRKVNAGSSDR